MESSRISSHLMGPWLFFPDHLFCPSQRKSRWTMSVHRIGFKYIFWGTSISMGSLKFFAWCKPNCSRDEFNIQSQVSDGRGPWDKFMVHGVNRPSCMCSPSCFHQLALLNTKPLLNFFPHTRILFPTPHHHRPYRFIVDSY